MERPLFHESRAIYRPVAADAMLHGHHRSAPASSQSPARMGGDGSLMVAPRGPHRWADGNNVQQGAGDAHRGGNRDTDEYREWNGHAGNGSGGDFMGAETKLLLSKMSFMERMLLVKPHFRRLTLSEAGQRSQQYIVLMELLRRRGHEIATLEDDVFRSLINSFYNFVFPRRFFVLEFEEELSARRTILKAEHAVSKYELLGGRLWFSSLHVAHQRTLVRLEFEERMLIDNHLRSRVFLSQIKVAFLEGLKTLMVKEERKKSKDSSVGAGPTRTTNHSEAGGGVGHSSSAVDDGEEEEDQHQKMRLGVVAIKNIARTEAEEGEQEGSPVLISSPLDVEESLDTPAVRVTAAGGEVVNSFKITQRRLWHLHKQPAIIDPSSSSPSSFPSCHGAYASCCASLPLEVSPSLLPLGMHSLLSDAFVDAFYPKTRASDGRIVFGGGSSSPIGDGDDGPPPMIGTNAAAVVDHWRYYMSGEALLKMEEECEDDGESGVQKNTSISASHTSTMPRRCKAVEGGARGRYLPPLPFAAAGGITVLPTSYQQLFRAHVLEDALRWPITNRMAEMMMMAAATLTPRVMLLGGGACDPHHCNELFHRRVLLSLEHHLYHRVLMPTFIEITNNMARSRIAEEETTLRQRRVVTTEAYCHRLLMGLFFTTQRLLLEGHREGGGESLTEAVITNAIGEFIHLRDEIIEGVGGGGGRRSGEGGGGFGGVATMLKATAMVGASSSSSSSSSPSPSPHRVGRDREGGGQTFGAIETSLMAILNTKQQQQQQRQQPLNINAPSSSSPRIQPSPSPSPPPNRHYHEGSRPLLAAMTSFEPFTSLFSSSSSSSPSLFSSSSSEAAVRLRLERTELVSRHRLWVACHVAAMLRALPVEEGLGRLAIEAEEVEEAFGKRIITRGGGGGIVKATERHSSSSSAAVSPTTVRREGGTYPSAFSLSSSTISSSSSSIACRVLEDILEPQGRAAIEAEEAKAMSYDGNSVGSGGGETATATLFGGETRKKGGGDHHHHHQQHTDNEMGIIPAFRSGMLAIVTLSLQTFVVEQGVLMRRCFGAREYIQMVEAEEWEEIGEMLRRAIGGHAH